LAEELSALRVADDDVLGAGFADHRPAHLAGERARRLPVQVLRGHADVRVARRLGRRVHRGERRRDDDLDVLDVPDEAAELLDEHDGLVDRLVHLPVAGDEGMPHGWRCYLSVSAATPGSTRPPRNSSDAPPPVEMWVILSATPTAFTAAIEIGR